MNNNFQLKQAADFIVRERVPSGDGPHPVLLLLHGLTGDENVMWVFTNRLDERYLILAPRGLHAAPGGGYSWHPNSREGYATVEDLRPAVDALIRLLTPEHFPQADFSRLRAIGFSQGAALTYTLGLMQPGLLDAFAGLSGFLPEGAKEMIARRPLAGKAAFVAHGTRDETVPIELAWRSVELLEESGARVAYCEEDVGHKLSAPCFRGMEAFFAGLDR